MYKIHLSLLLLINACICDWVKFKKQTFGQDMSNVDDLWDSFKEKFNKTYTGVHESTRKAIWKDNLYKIRIHNEEAANGLHSYTIKENHLSDMSQKLYLEKMVKLTKSKHRKLIPSDEIVSDFYHSFNNIPEEINWVEKGFTMPVYNQKDCGSCYAFSIAGVIQAQIFKHTKKLVPLSVQQIVDCSSASGNYGCGGGSLRNTLKYMEKVGGLMTYHDYPYKAKQSRCKYNKERAVVNISSWAILPAHDENSLERAVAKVGPIAASINASPHTFQLYNSGIYDDISCTGLTVNHAMLIVGYTKDAWILKNWWGSHWGENGYMRIRRKKNRCGISNYAAYALV